MGISVQKRKQFGAALARVWWLAVMLWCSAGMAYSAPKTVLVLGDSLSAEYGLARGTGWVALLDARLQQKYPGFRVINASISGDTSIGGLARLGPLLTSARPDIVILELGGNDGLRGLSLDEAETNLRTIIQNSQRAHARVLLVGMQIPPNYGHSYTEKFRTMYQRLANATHVALVPFLLDGVANHDELFQPDHIHLLAAAHPRLLENVWPYLEPMISGK